MRRGVYIILNEFTCISVFLDKARVWTCIKMVITLEMYCHFSSTCTCFDLDFIDPCKVILILYVYLMKRAEKKGRKYKSQLVLTRPPPPPPQHDGHHAPCRQHQVNKSEKQVNNRLTGRPSPLDARYASVSSTIQFCLNLNRLIAIQLPCTHILHDFGSFLLTI